MIPSGTHLNRSFPLAQTLLRLADGTCHRQIMFLLFDQIEATPRPLLIVHVLFSPAESLHRFQSSRVVLAEIWFRHKIRVLL